MADVATLVFGTNHNALIENTVVQDTLGEEVKNRFIKFLDE